MSQGPAGGKKFQVMNPPNTLKARVGVGGFDAGAVKRMESAIQNLKGEFEVQAKEHAAQLAAAAAELLRSPKHMEKRQAVYMLAHELRGQGGTFNYPLITRFGDQLCRYLDAADILDAKALVVVKAAADAIAVVTVNGVSGDGGETGRQLVAMLDKAVAQAKGEA
jgi:chemotaxis protein histidine kinase CheA